MQTSKVFRWVMGVGCLVTASSCAGPRAVEPSQTTQPLANQPAPIQPAPNQPPAIQPNQPQANQPQSIAAEASATAPRLQPIAVQATNVTAPSPMPGSRPRNAPKAINLAINAQGQIIFDRSPVTEDRFPALLATLQDRFGDLPVVLTADKTQTKKSALVYDECQKLGLSMRLVEVAK